MLTALEVLLKAARGMLKQGYQSELPNGECAYNGPNGAHCPVGFLIDPSQYREEFEGHAVDYPMILNALNNSGVGLVGDMGGILQRLQLIHDETFCDCWKNELTNLAKDISHQGRLPKVS